MNYLIKPSLRDNLIRPFSSIPITLTVTSSPTARTSSTFSTRSLDILEM